MDRPVAVAHCFYRSCNPSGENAAVEHEVELLRDSGAPVAAWYRRSDDLLSGGIVGRLRAVAGLHAGRMRVARRREELAATGADLLHVHNPWPLLTCGVFEAARQLGIPTAWTLHNYRLLATNRRLLGPGGARRPRRRDEREHLCRLAAQHGSALVDACYARAIGRYWQRGVVQECVDAFICLTQFQRRLLIEAGIAPERVVVKPNFARHDSSGGDGKGGYALFVGRLSAEKGVVELCRSWPRTGLPLKVVGDGPLSASLRRGRGIEFLGRRSAHEVSALLNGARFLVLNSNWYEGFPLVLAEAFASATPALAPAIGGIPEIVVDGRLGRLFAVGDESALVRAAQRLWEEAPAMRAACRTAYEQCYTPERNALLVALIHENLRRGRAPGVGFGPTSGDQATLHADCRVEAAST